MTIKVAIHGADVKLCYEKFDKLWGSSQGCCEKPMLIRVDNSRCHCEIALREV